MTGAGVRVVVRVAGSFRIIAVGRPRHVQDDWRVFFADADRMRAACTIRFRPAGQASVRLQRWPDEDPEPNPWRGADAAHERR